MRRFAEHERTVWINPPAGGVGKDKVDVAPYADTMYWRRATIRVAPAAPGVALDVRLEESRVRRAAYAEIPADEYKREPGLRTGIIVIQIDLTAPGRKRYLRPVVTRTTPKAKPKAKTPAKPAAEPPAPPLGLTDYTVQVVLHY